MHGSLRWFSTIHGIVDRKEFQRTFKALPFPSAARRARRRVQARVSRAVRGRCDSAQPG